MSGFDNYGISFTEPFNDEEKIDESENQSRIIEKLKEFILKFQNMRDGFIYRDELKHNYHLKKYYLCINIKDLSSFNQDLCDKFIEHPVEYLPLFEIAAKQAADEITYPRQIGNELVQDIQILFKWSCNPCNIRDIKSNNVSKLVKISGVVVSVSCIRTKAVSMTIKCRTCHTCIPNIKLKSGIDSFQLPRKCPSSSLNPVGVNPQCPLDPFYIVADKCTCVDAQIIKVQEMPDATCTGEMPRHIQLYCERNLVDCVSPGNKITILGIYCIKKTNIKSELSGIGVGLRKPYLRVVGIEHNSTVDIFSKSPNLLNFTNEEIEEFRKLSKNPKAYEIITNSIAPSIYGCNDIKKAIACHLFGGCIIKLPDSLILRGDINILLLGDPGTAKSQILKFVEKVAPIGLYTSGKGSSAAGLTASINRDPNTGTFIIEGGAMVLADGGHVCIDEFDKMREDDRVAIHEAMEQQTISIAKAGITTTLNSRCSVLAAANSVFGRWDDLKGSENINFMPTILSRFDMIFIVKDEHIEEKDITLARHVIRVHMSNASTNNKLSSNDNMQGELSLSFLKKYIDYCRKTSGPRLSSNAANRLQQHYIKVRRYAKLQEQNIGKRSPIVITVRQLEAISRIAESLAKMRLLPFATEEHVEEAFRLFNVSTWDAANRGGLSGAHGFTALADIDQIRRIETQIKQRFPVGTQVSNQRIIDDLLKQRFNENSIMRVLNIMIVRGDLEHRLQGKILYRVR